MWKILSGIRPRRDDGGASALHQSTAAGSSAHLPDAVKHLHDDKHSQPARRRSLRGAEEPEIVSTKDLEADDIVIAVMGPTGSGKSTFVCAASGRDTKAVGHTLRSFTDQVSAIKFWDEESGRHIVLVDTPGFDDTFKSDLHILSLISDWLVSSYNNKKLLSGILYLHRITDNRVAGSSLKNLRVFRKLCGRDALDKVYLTTTMWDEVESKVGEKRLEELKTEYWKAMISQGAQVAKCRSDDDSPKKLIKQIIRSEYSKTDTPYGGPLSQPPPPESIQFPSPHLQERTHGYDISRRGTPIPQPPVESKQEPSPLRDDITRGVPIRQSSVQNKQELFLSAQENSSKSDVALGEILAHVENRQGPSSRSQGKQRYDGTRGGLQMPQPLPTENEQWAQQSQQGARGYDIAHGRPPTLPPSAENKQGASSQFQYVEKQTHTGRDPATRRGSTQVPEESEKANARDSGVDDNLPAGFGPRGPGNGTEPNRRALLIQNEMAELKKELKETAAGQQLYSQLETLVEKQLQLLRRIDKERKGTLDPEMLQELQTEYDDLRSQIDDKLRQMQHLKLPWLRRFFSRRRD